MVVYLDLIFLTNICFDTAIVMMTAKVRGIRITRTRTAIAVLLGATYVLFMFFPAFELFYTVAAKLLFSLLVVYAAFGFGGLQYYLRNLGAFYLVHFVAAGAIFAVHFLLLSSSDVMNRLLLQPSGQVAFAVESGLWISVPVFVLSMIFLRSVFVSKARTDAVRSYVAEVQVIMEDTVIACQGLIDTGNQLYDPLTRTPVLVMELEQWKGLLPQAWVPYIKTKEVDRIFAELGREAFAWPDRLRLIPYRGINGGSQFMLALKPDKVVITTGSATFEAGKVLVALDGGKLNGEGAYQAIIHPVLVETPN